MISRDAGPSGKPDSVGGRGRNSLIYTGPEGKPGGETRFPLRLSLITDSVLNTKLSTKKKKKKNENIVYFYSVSFIGDRETAYATGFPLL